MNQPNNPIDLDKFKALVESRQGIERHEVFDNFYKGQPQNTNTSKSRMGSAQRKGKEAGWLFIQKEGKTRRYFTIEYAKANKVPAIIKPKSYVEKKKDERADEVETGCLAASLDRLMKPNLNSWNGCTF